jgi:Cu-Zn family superoxide dismutase
MREKLLSSSVGVVLVVVGLTLGACGERAAEPVAEATPTPMEEPAPAEPTMAAAQLAGPSGVTGVVTFTAVPAGGVEVVARIENLAGAPGEHGLHVHEGTSCDPPSFQTAGTHFNPSGAPHAGPHVTPRHAGDLGNVEVGADGAGAVSLTTDLLTLDEGPSSVMGRAVILHEKADDLTSQPTGDAGGRLACGIVTAVEGTVDPTAMSEEATPTPASGAI